MNVIAKNLQEVEENAVIDVDYSHLEFFKAYLKLNEDFAMKQDQIGATVPEEFTGIKRATWLATASLISYYDFSYNDQLVAAIQLVKAMYCSEFIQQYNADLYELYLNAKGITGFDEYVKKMFPLTQLAFGDAVTINGLNNENQKFLDLFNHQTDVEETEENTYPSGELHISNLD